MNKSLQKLRTVVVDDEPWARKLLLSFLEKMPEIEIVGEGKNGKEALQVIQDTAPDLLFLDIRMPGMSGFDVVKALQSDLMPNVIFCTAYQRYALDAFDLHAVDYVLKPVDEERLRRAVDRALQRVAASAGRQEAKTPLVGAIDEIASRVVGRSRPNAGSGTLPDGGMIDNRLAIKTQDSTQLVDIVDIDWVDAAGDYMCVHVKGETLILRSTLNNLIAKLDPEKFKRIHRSTLVNLDRIVKVTPLKKGEFMLELAGENRLKVSRNYRHSIKQFLDER